LLPLTRLETSRCQMGSDYACPVCGENVSLHGQDEAHTSGMTCENSGKTWQLRQVPLSVKS
jgi:hypothetical protein